MESVPSIDLTNGDVGLSVLWILFPALVITNLLKKRAIIKGGWRGTGPIVSYLLMGLAISSVFVGALAVWQRMPPQFFTRMQVAQEDLILGFRWPKADLKIPFGEIREVSITRGRRSRNRINILTPTETFRSFGYSSLTDKESAVLDVLRGRVDAHAAKQSPPARVSE